MCLTLEPAAWREKAPREIRTGRSDCIYRSGRMYTATQPVGRATRRGNGPGMTSLQPRPLALDAKKPTFNRLDQVVATTFGERPIHLDTQLERPASYREFGCGNPAGRLSDPHPALIALSVENVPDDTVVFSGNAIRR